MILIAEEFLRLLGITRALMDHDENLSLFTHNRELGYDGVAHFYGDELHMVKVFEGNSDGSDDKEMDVLQFLKSYDFKLGYDEDHPFMEGAFHEQ